MKTTARARFGRSCIDDGGDADKCNSVSHWSSPWHIVQSRTVLWNAHGFVIYEGQGHSKMWFLAGDRPDFKITQEIARVGFLVSLIGSGDKLFISSNMKEMCNVRGDIVGSGG